MQSVATSDVGSRSYARGQIIWGHFFALFTSKYYFSWPGYSRVAKDGHPWARVHYKVWLSNNTSLVYCKPYYCAFDSLNGHGTTLFCTLRETNYAGYISASTGTWILINPALYCPDIFFGSTLRGNKQELRWVQMKEKKKNIVWLFKNMKI